jgi:hypothetical protein
MKKYAILSLLVAVTLAGAGVSYRLVRASDHDDGENDAKSRALNLTDHYVWVDTTDPSKINFAQSSNPRSLATYQYFFSTQARYELHVGRVANKANAPSGYDDVVFRFMFGAPDTTNVQDISLTVIKDGQIVGSAAGKTTNFAVSHANTGLTINNVSIGGQSYKFFAGLREDTFFFDVQRYFQVRSFLLDTFINGNPAAYLDKTCDGKSLGEAGGDGVHLFNPPSCAEDFTHYYNVNQIVLQTDIANLKKNGETTFDTWSTISIPK